MSSSGAMQKKHEENSFLDTKTMAEGSDPSPSPTNMVAAADEGNTENSNEENLNLSLDEFYHQNHNPPPQTTEGVSSFENGTSSISMDIENTQNLSLNIGNSYSNKGTTTPLVQEIVIDHDDAFHYEKSNWDSTIHELLDLGFSNHNENQQAHDHQQFQLCEAQNCSQSYHSSDLLQLHLNPNQIPCITNPIQNNTPNFQHSMGFLGDLPVGSDYDTSLHLNPAFGVGELFPSLPHGYTRLTDSRSGFLFGGGDEMEGNGACYQDGDGSQVDIGVMEFNRARSCSVGGRGRRGQGTMPIDKQRREQLNDKYQILRSLIPSPTKVDRASVVGDAIDYIRELIRTVNELKSLVEKKRIGRERFKRHKDENDASESCNIKPYGDGSIRTSWLQRKSKDSEVDVRIIDDEVIIKMVQRKKINCMLFVPKVLDELQLDLHHVAGGHVGEYCSFLFNSKIIEGSSVYASAIANRVIEVMDTQYAAAAVPHNSSY
ncbi:hypothetical protein HN51_004505 [Arachis hypogaea]|uniref:BHLH domain-containing protein n=1 Tax=Arachis hypogaea TaxID=3818 RepID=A0A445DI99_ARAHY|nr:transcription factor bHLH91 [Arachis hypogaea]XP_025694733.1 transcription factor bHLH91 [Arachis hypogaea]QHO38075.1 Transcription factor [Arachis hypogaea]RYR62904.1 hypothetical protein Ahy_A04g020657 [Arachis hypogaea]